MKKYSVDFDLPAYLKEVGPRDPLGESDSVLLRYIGYLLKADLNGSKCVETPRQLFDQDLVGVSFYKHVFSIDNVDYRLIIGPYTEIPDMIMSEVIYDKTSVLVEHGAIENGGLIAFLLPIHGGAPKTGFFAEKVKNGGEMVFVPLHGMVTLLSGWTDCYEEIKKLHTFKPIKNGTLTQEACLFAEASVPLFDERNHYTALEAMCVNAGNVTEKQFIEMAAMAASQPIGNSALVLRPEPRKEYAVPRHPLVGVHQRASVWGDLRYKDVVADVKALAGRVVSGVMVLDANIVKSSTSLGCMATTVLQSGFQEKKGLMYNASPFFTWRVCPHAFGKDKVCVCGQGYMLYGNWNSTPYNNQAMPFSVGKVIHVHQVDKRKIGVTDSLRVFKMLRDKG